MRRFKVSSTLLPFVENVLRRRAVRYELEESGDTKYILLPLSGEKFHKVVLRALMEKMQQEEGSDIPYVAEKEMNDFQVLSEVGDAFILK